MKGWQKVADLSSVAAYIFISELLEVVKYSINWRQSEISVESGVVTGHRSCQLICLNKYLLRRLHTNSNFGF